MDIQKSHGHGYVEDVKIFGDHFKTEQGPISKPSLTHKLSSLFLYIINLIKIGLYQLIQ
jgi:hypothetical protein